MRGPLPPSHSDLVPQELLAAAVAAHVHGRLAEAEPLYRAVLARCPDQPDALCNLGLLLASRGDAAEALRHYQLAVRAAPDHAVARTNLGAALLQAGRLDEAIAELQTATRLDPASFMAQNNLGTALRRAGRLAEAEAAYRQALRQRPDHASAHNNLGLLLYETGRPGQAVQHLRRAVSLEPRFAEAHANIAGPLLELGDLQGAILAYEEALALEPGLPAAHTGLLLTLHYSDRHTPVEIRERSRRFAALLADPLPRLTPRIDRDPDRPLRVGYVSPDLRQHSVAAFFAPLLLGHDRRAVTVLCYADVAHPDEVTARLRAASDGWRDVCGLSDEALARLVQEDRIDVLVDLAGHTRGNRLLCFARRPAPVQVTYLGYPGTTGLCTFDARLTDALADPPGDTDHHYSEPLWRLPGGFHCYEVPAYAPPVGPLPADERGFITFASFNNRPKVTGPVLRAWAALLRALPESRLLLKSAGLQDPEGQASLLQPLLHLGVPPDRVSLAGLVPSPREHLVRYGEVDIALDTFPYNGTTTTCEALCMGVPVVTLAGDRHAGRVGLSLLSQVGLSDLVATTEEEYVARAAQLARDRARLRALRQGLRERLRASPLCDAPRLCRAIEEAYRTLWRRFCAAGARAEQTPSASGAR